MKKPPMIGAPPNSAREVTYESGVLAAPKTPSHSWLLKLEVVASTVLDRAEMFAASSIVLSAKS
jgi:hypothetical protein